MFVVNFKKRGTKQYKWPDVKDEAEIVGKENKKILITTTKRQ